MKDPLYLQQVDRPSKILYIYNEMSTHVRSYIYATRGALM